MTTTDVLSIMVQRLVEGFQPIRIILFGLRARGDVRWDSDYDLLVVMPDGTDRMQMTLAMLRALADMPAPKDVIVTTPEEITRRGDLPGTILKPALSEGVTVYERP
ncbi:MAG: nucleotidyltransferase domain-containing protein [Dehalococcoidia bacterium]|nr:nucleotidyltransferase domain-containing protein [Dehalococcoidia bacterium]